MSKPRPRVSRDPPQTTHGIRQATSTRDALPEMRRSASRSSAYQSRSTPRQFCHPRSDTVRSFGNRPALGSADFPGTRRYGSGEANAHCNLVISRKHVLRFDLDIGKSVEERLRVPSPNARAAHLIRHPRQVNDEVRRQEPGSSSKVPAAQGSEGVAHQCDILLWGSSAGEHDGTPR